MALSTRMDLRQTQSLVMTPQLQQAIKLLQLSNVDLSAYLETELEQNPLLERDDGGEGQASERGEEPVTDGGEGEPAAADEIPLDGIGPDEAPPDVSEEDVWNDSGPGDGLAGMDGTAGSWSSGGGRQDFDNDEYSLEQTLQQDRSLRELLTEQLQVDIHDPIDRIIGLHLIDLVDEAGYVTAALDQVADRLDCPLDRVLAVLETLQHFNPSGIFARNLAECLALQLRERDRLDPAMRALLENLELLARRDVDALRRICGVDAEDLADMVREIRALDPKPGHAYDTVVAQSVTPEILMRPDGSGGWIVELNNDTVPRVLVDQSYYARVRGATRRKEDKAYLAETLQSANWLVKALHQRATTILKVASEIVRQQDAFFAHGIQFLKPLVLRDIAEAISMHESTVSRVTSNKYMATPRGVYELKYFFTSSIPSSAGDSLHSAESVRHRIRALIDAEPHEKVLSDDKIVSLLRDEGIDIARRTVAKYRESMRIPSSVQRRREKTMSLAHTRSGAAAPVY
jgi:RNA polymerase sigma-54 factor